MAPGSGAIGNGCREKFAKPVQCYGPFTPTGLANEKLSHEPWGVTSRSVPALVLSIGFIASAIAASAGVVPNATLTPDQLAARFLAQATFGPSPDSLAEMRAMGYDYGAWIDKEAAKPASSAVVLLTDAKAQDSTITTISTSLNRRARNQVMLSGGDQLRQRIAYALSQIVVVSETDSFVGGAQEASSDYYDMLARDALGNYRTLLMDVTRHPMMGHYLSHYKNRKANATSGTRPDENFAREVMQLFTIGLYKLNADGTYQTDTNGRPLEVYTNDNITELARVFTGFTDESANNTGTGTGRLDFPSATANNLAPMRMWEPQHDAGAKTLLAYAGARKPVLPAGQTGLQDVQDAIDNLVEHPNTAPFVSRLLIQRLVTSNPTSAYVGRVAAVFADNGKGERGDLLAVVKAILLDPEARDVSYIGDPAHGKLQEPFLRLTQILRAFRYNVAGGTLPYDFSYFFSDAVLGQFPMYSPSVFNFYLPDYAPAGPVRDAGLVAPEFQILTSVYAITMPNAVYNLIQRGTTQFTLNLADQETLAANPADLLDNLDLYLTHGTLSAQTRSAILTAMQGVTSSMVPSGSTLNLTRARLALYLLSLSPDFAILK
jgi:uncharacterized protein (DUF1800 family)